MLLKNSSKILCVSKTLIETLPSKYKHVAEYLPNGVDLDFYQSYRFKKKNDMKYISLIGISISEALFYLNIFPKIKRKYKEVKMLIVGGGPRYPLIKNYVKNNKQKEDFIITGYIPYSQIREYFYMTDVGLYPTLKNRYYDSACPLKIIEYSACNKPVVASDLEELRRLNFPNVFLANPNAQDFLVKITEALEYEGKFPNLEEYSWKNLALKLEKIIKSVNS